MVDFGAGLSWIIMIMIRDRDFIYFFYIKISWIRLFKEYDLGIHFKEDMINLDCFDMNIS